MAMMTALEARRLRKTCHGRAPRFPTQAPEPSNMPVDRGRGPQTSGIPEQSMSGAGQLVCRRDGVACLARQAGPGPRM